VPEQAPGFSLQNDWPRPAPPVPLVPPEVVVAGGAAAPPPLVEVPAGGVVCVAGGVVGVGVLDAAGVVSLDTPLLDGVLSVPALVVELCA
jgi:hypothetical protein